MATNARRQLEATGNDWLNNAPENERHFNKLVAALPKLHRALKPEGQLIIVETITPTHPDILAQELGRQSFTVSKIITPTEEPGAWSEFTTRHHVSMFPGVSKIPYIMLLDR